MLGVEFRFEFRTTSEIFFRSLAILGVAILAAGSAVHFTNQSCPVCKRNFREHRDYEDGLPVFNSLDVCPFCLTPIDADYGKTTS